jgi:type II secretory pathway predicted ATPase ExeA
MGSPFDRGPRGESPPGVTTLSAVPADPRSLGLSYESFYGLREQPFSLSPDPRYFYRSRLHTAAFEDLRNAIERRERVMAVSGDVGTGKTMLWRAVAEPFDHRLVTTLIPDPAVSRETFLKGLLADFGIGAADDHAGSLQGVSEAELRHLLSAHLRVLGPAGEIALVVIDEAQNMSTAVADELNALTDGDDPFQAILVGQIDLADKLASREMRRLDQRVSARCMLAPLDRAAVAGYVAYRLQKAGGSPDRVSFSDAALDVVHERSNGVPRLVNRLCDRALAAAYAQRAAVVDAAMVADGEPSARRTAPPPAPQPPAVVSPPSTAGLDAVDSWLAGIEEGPNRPPAAALVDVAPSEPDFMPEPIPAAPAPAGGPGMGIVLRVRIPRRPHTRRSRRFERRSDRWARRVGNVLLTLTILLAAVAAAPSVIDISAGLWSHVRTAFAGPAHPR